MSSSPQGLRPAKIITPAIRQRLQERLNEARKLSVAEACPHGQIDELLCECVIVDPGNTVYIGALLHHLRRSDRPRRTGFQPVSSVFLRLVGTDPLRPIRQAAEAQNWEEVLTLAPRALCQQPQSAELLRHLAAACAALEHEQAELCYLQAAVANGPDDAETQRQLARALTRQGLFDEAAIAWKRQAEMVPDDEECRQTIKILCEYEPPGGAPGILSDEAEQELRRVIESGSASIEQFRQIIHHLSNSRKHDEAERMLDLATVQLGNSLKLHDWREHLTMVRGWSAWEMSHDLVKISTEYQHLPERKRAESNRIDLQICGRRCERYPDDLGLQIQLGRLLNLNGNYSEAVKRLEPVAKIEAYRAEALEQLGRSWEKLKQIEKAMACYKEAIALAQSTSDQEMLQHSLRNAARLAERTGDLESAKAYYAQLLEFPAETEHERIRHNVYRLTLDNLNHVCHNS